MTDSRADRRDGTEQRTSPVTFYRQVVAFFMTFVSLLDLGFGKLVFELFTGGSPA
jgi:hypothetical protein